MSKIIEMMSTAEAEREVGVIIVPEIADEQARALVSLIYQVTNFEEPAQGNLAKEIAVAAFRHTTEYAETMEKAFGIFLKNAQVPVMTADKENADEMQQTTSSAVH